MRTVGAGYECCLFITTACRNAEKWKSLLPFAIVHSEEVDDQNTKSKFYLKCLFVSLELIVRQHLDQRTR